MSDLVWLFLACAVATYLTRIGGHLVLSRFESIPYRIEAALDAVPVAVLSALVAPYLVSKGPVEAIGMALTALVATRLSLIWTLVIGIGAIVAMRLAVGG